VKALHEEPMLEAGSEASPELKALFERLMRLTKESYKGDGRWL
jgi:hypothetical protein